MFSIIDKMKSNRMRIAVLGLLFFMVCNKEKSNINPNTNLQILLHEDNCNLINPKWVSNDLVYYIKCDSIDNNHGSVWRIKVDGSYKALVCPGSYGVFDISPNESLLACVMAHSNDTLGNIVLYNILTHHLDTLETIANPNSNIIFSGNNQSVYYENDYYHKLNIYNMYDTIIYWHRADLCGFDIFCDQILYYTEPPTWETPFYDVFININNGTLITYFSSCVWSLGYFIDGDSYLLKINGQDGLLLYYIDTGDTTILNTSPYSNTVWNIGGSCIDPDPTHTKIVFSAKDPSSQYELWILNNY